jgi:hypothetical protein
MNAAADPDANTPESRLPARIEVLPTPRRIDLATIDDVRLEMAKVYREMKSGDIPTQDGTRLAYVLAQIGRLIEANDTQRRIEALEVILTRRPKP